LADETTTTTPVETRETTAPFEEVLYWIYTSTDDFDLPRFRAALPRLVSRLNEAEVTVAPREGELGGYHASLSWNISADDVRLTLEFHAGGAPHGTDETEPYAEELIAWLGQFFGTDNVRAHLHVRLKFSTSTHVSTVPFALSTIAPFDAEVYGVALRLKGTANGVTSVRLTRGQSHWYAEVLSERIIVFRLATPFDDVMASSAVLSAFLKGKTE
jgi:hypothetical protein